MGLTWQRRGDARHAGRPTPSPTCDAQCLVAGRRGFRSSKVSETSLDLSLLTRTCTHAQSAQSQAGLWLDTMLHSLERVPRALWITAAAAVASAVGTTGSTSHGSEAALARGVSRVALARCAPACEQAASDSARPYRGSDSGAGSWHKPAATAAAPAPAGWSPLRTPIAPRTSRTYTSEEVAEHDGSAAAGGSLWVTVGDGVYDVTSFQHEHPGGADFIRQAGGGSVAGFWAHWAYHYVRAVGLLRALSTSTAAAQHRVAVGWCAGGCVSVRGA